MIDAKERIWYLDLTLATVWRVHDDTGMSLAQLFVDGLTELDDPTTFAGVLFAIFRPEAERRKVSERDFLESFAGAAHAVAAHELRTALINFFELDDERYKPRQDDEEPEAEQAKDPDAPTDEAADQREGDQAAAPPAKPAKSIDERIREYVWAAAGRLGIDPRPFTLRNLHVMDMAHLSSQWDYASQVLSAIITAGQMAGSGLGAKFKKPPPSPADYHPFHREERRRIRNRPKTREELRAGLLALAGVVGGTR